SDYARVLEEMDRDGGPTLEFRFALMQKTFAHTAKFDTVISQTMETIRIEDGAFLRGGGVTGWAMPAAPTPLRYGENPHQSADWISWPAEIGGWQVHQGKGLSYTNLLDVDAALR